MTLNDLFNSKGIEPQQVIILRHRPSERELNKVLPWIAAERPDVFNAYQQTQGPKLEKVMNSMKGTGYVASFMGHEPRKALFIGLYSIGQSKALTYDDYWNIPAYKEMKQLGMKGFTKKDPRSSVLWFDLRVTDFYSSWKGKLIISWPPPELSWWRRAHRNEMSILAILEGSALEQAMPLWRDIVLKWEELAVLPSSWKAALSQWRGIYYIFDATDRKGYVGSAYGTDNLLGRWHNYATHGDGGNRLLRDRDPRHFQFSILERVSPDMDACDVIQLENSWKERLCTRQPHGLNDN